MIAVRPVAPDEHHAFARVNALAMGRSPVGAEPPSSFEPGRALAAVDGGDRLVGVAETVTLDVSVPGGDRLPFAGVRGVGVLPTHRRRGVLTALMRAQLDDAHERGEPLAGLWTTAAAIYPRFGYGIASFGQRISIERPAPRIAPVEGIDVRFAGTPKDLDAARSVYEGMRDAIPGMASRTDEWWAQWQDAENAITVLADVGDGLGGYARYTIERDWRADGPAHDLYVGTVMGATPAATATLWRYLLEIDLVVSWSWFHAPVFDPLPLLVDDLRRVQRGIGDGLWLRLVDVPAALSARAYATDVDCVIEVTDGFCPWNTGAWHLDAGGCTRAGSGARADVTVTASALASAYLGGVSVADLVRAGHATARTDEVANRLSTAFSWPTPPWAVTWI